MVRNINYTIQNSLCVGCGICEGACPSKAISMVAKKGRYVPCINTTLCKNDKGCHRCLQVCPGIGTNIGEMSEELFPLTKTSYDKVIGHYQKCYVGYSNNFELRYHSASGGMITQMLLWLLERNYINGAFITKFNPQKEYLLDSFLATTKEQIIQSKGSKYAPVTLNHVIQNIKIAQGKFVIVGMPCHIQALRKYERLDRKFKEKIFGYFGLYCSCGRTFNLTKYIFSQQNIKTETLSYFAYRDEGCLGSMVAKWGNRVFKEKYQNYFHPLRSFFIPKRCLLCVDHYARLSDVSFGDIHIDPYKKDRIGINSVVVRSEKFIELFSQAQKDGMITLDSLNTDVLNASQTMARRKFHRIGAYLKIAHILGNEIPHYDLELPVNNVFKYAIEYLVTRTQQIIGSHQSLWIIIDILKRKIKK